LLSAGVVFFIYKAYFFSNADYRYTVALVNGEYHDSKTHGVTFQYKVEGKIIQSDCIDNECHNLKEGSRYIVKYFIERPSWNSLLTQHSVPTAVEAPVEGWKEIPKWQLP
jgi:hypothetical protein